ncbi:MAG: hypothetical protein AVDCRST_MAG22-1964, partial [uncultured Rubrobacteraceae bacterium]
AKPGTGRPRQGAPSPQGRRRGRPHRRLRREDRHRQHPDARRLQGMPPLPTGLRLRDREPDPARSARSARDSRGL